MGGEYAKDDIGTFTGGVEFYLPATEEYTTSANALSNQTSPSTASVNVSDKLTLIQLSIGYKRYFVGEFDDDFNVYGTIKAGMALAPYTFTVDETSYDKTAYGLNVTNYDASIPGSKETLGNFTIGGGFGAEKELSRDLYFTAEVGVVIPATSANSRTGAGAYDLPAAARIALGIKKIL